MRTFSTVWRRAVSAFDRCPDRDGTLFENHLQGLGRRDFSGNRFLVHCLVLGVCDTRNGLESPPKGRHGPLLAVIHAIAIVVIWRVFLDQWVLLDFRDVVEGSLKDFALGLFNMVSGYVLFVTGFRAPLVLRAVLLPDQAEPTGQ